MSDVTKDLSEWCSGKTLPLGGGAVTDMFLLLPPNTYKKEIKKSQKKRLKRKRMRAIIHLISLRHVDVCKEMLTKDGFTVLSSQGNQMVIHGNNEVFCRVFHYRIGMYEIPDKFTSVISMITIAP